MSTILRLAKGTSKSFDGGTRSLDWGKVQFNRVGSNHLLKISRIDDEKTDTGTSGKKSFHDKCSEFPDVLKEVCISSLFCDMLQKEVIALRKTDHRKDLSLGDKDDCIEVAAVHSFAHKFELFLPICFIF